MTKTYIIVALVSYLLGSIPFGYILVKLFLKQDIRTTGSGNIGATNVARSGAKMLGIATLVLDAAKGALAVVVAGQLWRAQTISYSTVYYSETPSAATFVLSTGLEGAMTLAAFCAVLGHVFPLWLKFRGGKGVATAIGAFMVVAPEAAMVSLVLFLVVVGISRFVSLGSIVGAGSFPVFAFLSFDHLPTPIVLSAATSLLIVAKHHENIRRLLAGTENKFGGKKPVLPADAMEKQA